MYPTIPRICRHASLHRILLLLIAGGLHACSDSSKVSDSAVGGDILPVEQGGVIGEQPESPTNGELPGGIPTEVEQPTEPGTLPDTGEPTVGSALPIPLDPFPANSVELSVDNALNVGSAVFRSQRTLTALLNLTADLQALTAGTETTPLTPLSLGNEFCDSGDGTAQPSSLPFSGAESPVQIDLNKCSYHNTLTTGEITMARFNDNTGYWTVVELNDVEIQIDSTASVGSTETVQINSGRFRIQADPGVGDTLAVTAVGESVEMVIGGYAMGVAPFESSQIRNETASETSVEHRLSLTTELLGGTVFSKPSVPMILNNAGLAISGGITLRGMGSPAIEWFAGSSMVLPEGLDPETTDVLADVRSGTERSFVGNSWEEFLAAF